MDTAYGYKIGKLHRLYVEIQKNDINKWQSFKTMTSTQMALSTTRPGYTISDMVVTVTSVGSWLVILTVYSAYGVCFFALYHSTLTIFASLILPNIDSLSALNLMHKSKLVPISAIAGATVNRAGSLVLEFEGMFCVQYVSCHLRVSVLYPLKYSSQQRSLMAPFSE
jgi:hypothetical protein